MQLPWKIDEAASIAADVAEYRGMSPEGKLALVAAACRSAMKLLAARDDAERALSHRDPLPDSSLRALARLRAEAAERRGA